MKKSLFAGLTVLDADESIIQDGAAFQSRDRELIDYFLELGAKVHRHDGTAGLADPNQPVGASAVASAGVIEADRSFTLGYTLEDEQRGETLISPPVTISMPAPIAAPTSAPTASADYSTGELPVDTFYYAKAWSDGIGGETPIGPAEPAERSPGFANARIALTGLTTGMAAASADSWRLYRAVGGGNYGYLASGTADTYMDDGQTPVQPDLEPLPSDINTTNSDNTLLVALPSADGIVDEGTFINLYASEAGDFVGDVLLEQFPVASAGQQAIYPDIALIEGRPPDVSTSVGGASQINPDEEILDWHWRRPVAGTENLGSGVLGDVKLVTGTGDFYGMLAASGSGFAEWTELGSGAAAQTEHELGYSEYPSNVLMASADGEAALPLSVEVTHDGAPIVIDFVCQSVAVDSATPGDYTVVAVYIYDEAANTKVGAAQAHIPDGENFPVTAHAHISSAAVGTKTYVVKALPLDGDALFVAAVSPGASADTPIWMRAHR